MLKKYSLQEHFNELKNRLLLILILFLILFGISYYYNIYIYNFLLYPLKMANLEISRIIYTSFTEAFSTYISISLFSAFVLLIPFIMIQLFLFIKPALMKDEQKFLLIIQIFSFCLFALSSIFVYYFVMPRAWSFFYSFQEANGLDVPLVMDLKISEYIYLTIKLIIAFAIVFQFPVIVVIASFFDMINYKTMKNTRRFAIVGVFIVAAIATPPDIVSQILLAIPLLLLYEISILLCKKFSRNK